MDEKGKYETPASPDMDSLSANTGIGPGMSAQGFSTAEKDVVIDNLLLRKGDKIYNLTDIIEGHPEKDFPEDTLKNEIMKKVSEMSEKIAREMFPEIAEKIIREEIEKLKKQIAEEQMGEGGPREGGTS